MLVISLFTGCAMGQNNDSNSKQTKTPSNDAGKDKAAEANSQPENNPSNDDSSPNEPVVTDSPTSSPPKIDKGDIKIKPGDVDKVLPSISYEQDGSTIYFSFKVKSNIDGMFTFHFDTSQQFDYTITDKDGNIVRNYSKEGEILKLPSEQPVKPGGSIVYEEIVDKLPHGLYRINFVLIAKEMQPKTSIQFEVK